MLSKLTDDQQKLSGYASQRQGLANVNNAPLDFRELTYDEVFETGSAAGRMVLRL